EVELEAVLAARRDPPAQEGVPAAARGSLVPHDRRGRREVGLLDPGEPRGCDRPRARERETPRTGHDGCGTGGRDPRAADLRGAPARADRARELVGADRAGAGLLLVARVARLVTGVARLVTRVTGVPRFVARVARLVTGVARLVTRVARLVTRSRLGGLRQIGRAHV